MNVLTMPLAARPRQDLLAAQAAALAQLAQHAHDFGLHFPEDATEAGVYRPRQAPPNSIGANVGWTTGFWTGMGWLAYELSERPLFQLWAQGQYPSYVQRVSQRIDLDHHDLGFLYGPAVAAFGITGDTRQRALALDAAQVLVERFLPGAGVIQAWGKMGDPDDKRDRGRIIIDTLMNLPLLHWASVQTGDLRFSDVARSHLARCQPLLVRGDGSSAHSCHVDPDNGATVRVSTVQGHADDSCWARGQAWGIYGLALNHRFAPDLNLVGTACRMADFMLSRLPDDGVCQWDLALGWCDGEQRDSSASAIAACGLLELAVQLAPGEQRRRYEQAALHMVDGLARTCAAPLGRGHGLLLHGVYSLPELRGVDEANLWGDYYYLEALARVNTGWRSYWHAGAVGAAGAAKTQMLL